MKTKALRAGLLIFGLVSVASYVLLWRLFPQLEILAVLVLTGALGIVAALLAIGQSYFGRSRL